MFQNKVVAFCGTAESGKTTGANYICGSVLKSLIGGNFDFRLNELGQLLVLSDTIDANGEVFTQYNRLDLDNMDDDFRHWCNYGLGDTGLWRHCKNYSLAGPLKRSVCDILGLTYEQISTDKNSETRFTYDNFYNNVDTMGKTILRERGKEKVMTARDVMEILGTKVFKSIYEDCFIDSLIRRINMDNVPLAVVSDVRRKNEVERIQSEGGIVIRLLRGLEPNTSEVDINESVPDEVIGNREMDISTFTVEINRVLTKHGVFNELG